MTQPSDGGEHEGENLKEVFGEPFNFIKLNLNVNGNSIGGKVVLYLVTEDLKGDLNLSEMPNVDAREYFSCANSWPVEFGKF